LPVIIMDVNREQIDKGVRFMGIVPWKWS
jgi:hypothetical protein